MINPFSEVALFEQNNSSDSFYATGSSPSVGDDATFITSLENKEQIRLSFPVSNKVRMLENSSSIYYFNINKKQWNIPQTALGDITGPVDKISFATYGGNFSDPGDLDTTPPLLAPIGTNGSYCFEDKIGFDSYGNPIASGSLIIHRWTAGSKNERCQTIEDIGKFFTIEDSPGYARGQISIMTDDYYKSVQRNEMYKASDDETFVLPIEKPFLIEKVVVEIPFCMGTGWFFDKTVTNFVQFPDSHYRYVRFDSGIPKELDINYNPVDEGGPALTLALFCQKKYGKETIRDLVCRHVITHENDMSEDGSEIDIKELGINVPANEYSLYLNINIDGIKRNIQDFSTVTVVTGSLEKTGEFFTGSVMSKIQPDISNGIKIHMLEFMSGSYNKNEYIDLYENSLSQEFLSIEPEISFSNSKLFYEKVPIVVGVDPFGRGMSGFSPSGGSIFGKEFVTSQNRLLNNKIFNPYYTEDPKIKEKLKQNLSDEIEKYHVPPPIVKLTQLNLGSSAKSPYLINPGEKLLLSISKTRPSYQQLSILIDRSSHNVNINTGKGVSYNSYLMEYYNNTKGHDVQFNTGSINICFYGSYVKENKEYIP